MLSIKNSSIHHKILEAKKEFLMILFIVNKFNKIYKDSFYTIPDNYGANDINEGNIQLISWNEVKYKPTGSFEGKPIENVNNLFTTILEVAKKDPVCQDMNEQFKFMYKKNDGKDEYLYYGSYEGDVTAGINCDEIDFKVDKDKKILEANDNFSFDNES